VAKLIAGRGGVSQRTDVRTSHLFPVFIPDTFDLTAFDHPEYFLVEDIARSAELHYLSLDDNAPVLT
jgi:hypothetical protein